MLVVWAEREELGAYEEELLANVPKILEAELGKDSSEGIE